MNAGVLQESPDGALYRYTCNVALLLLALQVTDALLTGIGMFRFGIDHEGNPLLRSLMLEIGAIPALILVKSFACLCVLLMAVLVRKVRWVPHAMLLTSAAYIAFAVLPWSYYLFILPIVETATILAY